MIERFLSNNTSNLLKFIMTLTRGKNLSLPWQKWNDDSMTHTFKKSQACKQHDLVTFAKLALNRGSLLVTVRVLKGQRLQ